ncbi:MAG: hypothetical protein O2979_09915 [Proteobacteria bacterium]|nr:hypothetical protein [Pseudomonadota bacterium]
MNKVTSISVAVVCALGMSAAVAQTVQRGTSVQGAAATTKAPVLVAQAGGAAAGGASTGASTAGAAGTAGTVGLTTTLVVVGVAAGIIAVSVDNGSTTTHH